MDNAIYQLGRSQWLSSVGYDDLEKDEDGFVVLKPSAQRVDSQVASLTTNISDLESKLKKFRAEKAAAEKYQKTPEYKESKKTRENI